MRNPSWHLVISFLIMMLLAVDAAVCGNLDAVQRSVERNLALATARSTLSSSEALRLRRQLNAIIKQRQTAKALPAQDAQIMNQMWRIQHEIDVANERALASRSLRFF